MTYLIAGASGATGRHLVLDLIHSGHDVIAVVRSRERFLQVLEALDKSIRTYLHQLEVIESTILDLKESELGELVRKSDAMASCLGHNLTFHGMFGNPRHLVRDSIRAMCKAAKVEKKQIPLILMNTTGNRNRDLREKFSFGENLIITLMRFVLPPHRDNEEAAEYLRTKEGQRYNRIPWVTVRPDTLIDETKVSFYETHPSPIRSPLFNPGKTSRINVANFMARLMTQKDLLKQWEGQMPVLYNS